MPKSSGPLHLAGHGIQPLACALLAQACCSQSRRRRPCSRVSPVVKLFDTSTTMRGRRVQTAAAGARGVGIHRTQEVHAAARVRRCIKASLSNCVPSSEPPMPTCTISCTGHAAVPGSFTAHASGRPCPAFAASPPYRCASAAAYLLQHRRAQRRAICRAGRCSVTLTCCTGKQGIAMRLHVRRRGQLQQLSQRLHHPCARGEIQQQRPGSRG